MDTIMDPELASEMVKLLGQELKVVRAQLREAERRTNTPSVVGLSNGPTHDERAHVLTAENDALKAENVALQERIAKLQHDLALQAFSVKLEEGSLNPFEELSRMSAEFAQLLAENEGLVRNKEKALQDQEKLQEKYRRSKAKVNEYNEILDELRAALSSYVEELEQSRKVSVTEIDVRGFLEDLSYKSVEGQPGFSSIQSYPRRIHIELHKDAADVCDGLYFINCNEIVWSPSGIALGLVIKPNFQYNPKVHGGTWRKFEDSFTVGTYERVADHGTMLVASETLKHQDNEKLNYVSRRTTLFPDFVPPSQTQMIKNMYKQGVIKLQCFVIRCVAVNQTFAEKLRDASTSYLQQNPSDSTGFSTSAGTSMVTQKRKREPKPNVHWMKSKRRYGLLHAT